MPMFNLGTIPDDRNKGKQFYVPREQPLTEPNAVDVPDKYIYGHFKSKSPGIFKGNPKVPMHPGAQQAVADGFPLKRAFDVVVDSAARSRNDYVVCTPPFPHVTDHALIIFSVKTYKGGGGDDWCPELKKGFAFIARIRKIAKNIFTS